MPADPRLIGAVVLLVAFVAIALFVPHPDAEQIRNWARAAGPWFPLVFFVAHALATVALPRLPFTLSAGLLFGPVTGIAVAISATTVSAALAFLLARAIGRDAIAAAVDPPGGRGSRPPPRPSWLARRRVTAADRASSLPAGQLLRRRIIDPAGALPDRHGRWSATRHDRRRRPRRRAQRTHRSRAGRCHRIGVAIGVAGLLVDAGLGIEEPDADDPVGARSHV